MVVFFGFLAKHIMVLARQKLQNFGFLSTFGCYNNLYTSNFVGGLRSGPDGFKFMELGHC